MPSAELERVIAAKRANPYTPDKSVAQLRHETEENGRKVPLPEGTTCTPVDADGVPGEWIAAPGASRDKVFYFIHGGGYYRGSVAASRGAAASISASTGAPCLSLDYRLAPEHPFPAAKDDVHTGFGWLLKQGIDPKRIVVGGISAGGGLTLALILALREAGEPLPAAAVPISAWTDLAQTGESYRSKADVDPTISKTYLDRMAAYYLNGADPRNPFASPLYADFGGLPPMLVQVGSAETMLDDSTGLAERARQFGVDVTLEVWEGLIHGWHGSPHSLPEARQAIRRIGEFFRRHVE